MAPRRIASALLLAVLTLSLASTPVFGADPARDALRLTQRVAESANPEAAFAALTDAQQQLVLDYTELASTVSSVAVAPSATSSGSGGLAAAAVTKCWTWTWNRQGRNVFGAVLWQFNQQINWCADGTRITNVPFRKVWSNPVALFWTYNGLVESSTAGGKGFTTYRSFVQGSYSYCPPPGVCWQNDLPWLDMTAHGDGRGTGSGGG